MASTWQVRVAFQKELIATAHDCTDHDEACRFQKSFVGTPDGAPRRQRRISPIWPDGHGRR